MRGISGRTTPKLREMLAVVGASSLDALVDAIVPGNDQGLMTPLALPAAINEEEALAKIRAIAAKNQVYPKLHRAGLLRHAHAESDPAQRSRKSGLVHGVHAVSGGNFAGPAGSADQLSDDGVRPDRHGDRQLVAARRSDRRGRGDDACKTQREEQEQRVSGRGRLPSADDRGRAARAPSRWASRSRSASCRS